MIHTEITQTETGAVLKVTKAIILDDKEYVNALISKLQKINIVRQKTIEDMRSDFQDDFEIVNALQNYLLNDNQE